MSKKFQVKRNFEKLKFGVQRNFKSENIWVQLKLKSKKFWVQQNMGPNKSEEKQAGAELGQAQLKLGLGFTSIKYH